MNPEQLEHLKKILAHRDGSGFESPGLPDKLIAEMLLELHAGLLKLGVMAEFERFYKVDKEATK